VRAVRAATERDIASGGKYIRVVVIDEKGTQFLPDRKITDMAK
jgi:20S proteasome alpha/beta subunit